MNARYFVRNRLKWAGISILLVGSVVLQAGCADAFLGEDVENTPENNFDVLWQDIDRYYALFALKDVSWDSLYAALRPRITPAMSEDSLFGVLCDMISSLNDIHVLVQTGEQACLSDQSEFVNDLKLQSVERFLTDDFSIKAGGRLYYGQIHSEEQRLGYLYLSNFSGDGTPVASWVDEVDTVLEELSDTDGLIVDVRSNSGGNGFNAADLAGRFTNTSRPYLMTQTRNGPPSCRFYLAAHLVDSATGQDSIPETDSSADQWADVQCGRVVCFRYGNGSTCNCDWHADGRWVVEPVVQDAAQWMGLQCIDSARQHARRGILRRRWHQP